MSIKISRVLCIGILIAGIITGACSTSKNYYIKPGYENQEVNSPLLIMPVQQDWFNRYFAHTFGSLSGKDKMAFNSLLNPLFAEHTPVHTTVYSPDSSLENDLFELSTLSVGEDKYEVVLPASESLYSDIKPSPRYLVILDQFYFRRRVTKTTASGYAGHEGGAGNRLLYFETKYVFWDTQQQEPVAWGLTDAKISVSDTITLPNYSEVMSKAIKKILDNGPVVSSG